MNINEFDEDSDTSDEDYIPVIKPEEVVSEVESDGEDEEPFSDTEFSPKKKRSRSKRSSKAKLLKAAFRVTNDKEDGEKCLEKELTEAEKKQQADALWANFLQDTDFKSKKTDNKIDATNVSNEKKAAENKCPEKLENNLKKQPAKVKITEIFEFAGEEVKVEKEVSKDSAEARLLGSSNSSITKGKKGGSLSGIGNVLSQLGKKKKISTLEKTKLDWDRFKKDENLEEEISAHNKGKDGTLEKTKLDWDRFKKDENLEEEISAHNKRKDGQKKISTLEKTKLDWDRFKKDENLEEEISAHNKGKDGYLERQDFLQRADLRRFEIEKEVRAVERNKRMNMGDSF